MSKPILERMTPAWESWRGWEKDALELPRVRGNSFECAQVGRLSWGARLEDSGPPCAVMEETCGVPQERRGSAGSPEQGA